MIELYAFARGLRGDFETVSLSPSLTAVIGPAGGDEHEDVVRHGLVVQSLVDSADAVLPARFGERFADAAALTVAVAPRRVELERLLAGVDGCVELSVRVARVNTTEPQRVGDGGTYMRSRLRAVTADAAAAAALHALLRRRARDAVVTDTAVSRLIHDAYYLVERDRVDEFARSVEAYASAHPDLSLVCTGPWAPASFVGAS